MVDRGGGDTGAGPRCARDMDVSEDGFSPLIDPTSRPNTPTTSGSFPRPRSKGEKRHWNRTRIRRQNQQVTLPLPYPPLPPLPYLTLPYQTRIRKNQQAQCRACSIVWLRWFGCFNHGIVPGSAAGSNRLRVRAAACGLGSGAVGSGLGLWDLSEYRVQR